MTAWWRAISFLGAGVVFTGCGAKEMDDGSDGATEDGAADDGGALTGDPQTPPRGARALNAWLVAGHYTQWACEPSIHPARSPGAHGHNRICNNAAMAEAATGSGDWPAGAAAVKELYTSAADTTPKGYAVALKIDDDSASGAGWYWYEILRIDRDDLDDTSSVVADGPGDAGGAKSICIGCHAAAGSDADHTPTPGGRDFVYTPVP